MSLKIWSYNTGSRTAKELAARLRCRVLAAPESTRWMPSRGDTILNFGNSDYNGNIDASTTYRLGANMINHPTYVNEYADKLQAFCHIANVDTLVTVPYTDDINLVRMWLENGSDVVARHKLRGHSGDGIEIIPFEAFRRGNGTVPAAPLYTKYVKKSVEHRIHMFKQRDGTVNYIWQQKRRRFECTEPNWAIRNYENGFIYAVEDVEKPANWEAIQQGLESSIDLTFSATDLITPNNTNPRGVRQQGPMVLEVNSAPGLSSPTLLDFYVSNIQQTVRDNARA